MPIFVIFVFGSIVLGAGAMLAPALPTHGPRIGLAAALSLAMVIVGAIGYAALFGWNTLVIDYLWFALLVGIFLTGTLSAGMFRSEAQGGTKEYSGWPGPRELAFFTMTALIFAAPALILPVPLGSDAQGFGYLGLSLKLGGTLTALAPYHPEINWLYAPGFPAIVAYLGTQLNAGLHSIELALGAVLPLIFVWLAYDFGNELDESESRRTGIAMAVASLIGTGLLFTALKAHYTALLAMVFALAFLTFVLRFHHEGKRVDFIGAAVTLAGVMLSQPDTTFFLMPAYILWLLSTWFVKPMPSLRRWLGLAFGIPLFALLLIAPWLSQIRPLIATSPQIAGVDLRHLLDMISFHGLIIIPLVLIGIVLAVRKRGRADWLMLIWFLLVVDYSGIGLLRTLLPFLANDSINIAQYGAVIPYMYFGGNALLWIIDKIGRSRAEHWIRLASLPLINTVALIVVLIMIFIEPVLSFSKTLSVKPEDALASSADVQAMLWLKQNSPPDALILNYPADQEGDWVPVIAQRNAVYFPLLPFFSDTEKSVAQQQELLAFWHNPSDLTNVDLLHAHNIDYVIVPQVITRPDLIQTMFRWHPVPNATTDSTSLKDVSFLELVFEQDGAQVYRLKP